MAQFPISNDQGILDAMNYLLSGPTGLGQNFAGFNSSLYADATGNYRPPFTIDNFGPGNPPSPNFLFYVAPISLGTSEMLDERTWKFTFATPLTGVPFQLGQPITVTGVTDPYYDGNYGPIGVIECTLTYVVARSRNDYTVVAPSTGGTVELNSMNTELSTDCNAKVTVTGSQQRVILNAQLNNSLVVDYTIIPGQFLYVVELNRYKAIPTNDPTNPDFVFIADGNVASKTYVFDAQASDFDPNVETLFVSIVDNPGLGKTDFKGGYYWYILEVKYIYDGSPADTPIITGSTLGLRSFSAQVLKP